MLETEHKMQIKNGIICLVLMFPCRVMVLKLSKKFIFCNFMMTLARKLESDYLIIFYIYSSEKTWYALSETENFQMQYVNCFNRLRFLAEVSTKLQICAFLYNLKTITPEVNMKTREMTSFFHLLFPLFLLFHLLLNVCNIHFGI